MSEGRVFPEDGWYVATWFDHGIEKRIGRFSCEEKAFAARARWQKEVDVSSNVYAKLWQSYGRNPQRKIAGEAFRRNVPCAKKDSAAEATEDKLAALESLESQSVAAE